MHARGANTYEIVWAKIDGTWQGDIDGSQLIGQPIRKLSTKRIPHGGKGDW
jgi:hypothetical protein